MTEQSAGEILLYQRDDGSPSIEVQLDAETVWLSQHQIAQLFQTSRENITMHLSNVFDEQELDPEATRKDFLQVRQEGSRSVRRQISLYNLDAIISVGYRVKSKTATQFRIWATQRLREYLVKGFAMDDEKLKNLGGGVYWRELLERIRDIRSSEKVLYRQLLDLYATSIDYDPDASETATFFKVIQNKFHYGAHGHTAAEVIAERADASQPNMGLVSFVGERPKKAEVSVAKNYLDENELKRLNTLVSTYFEAAEFRAQNHELTRMADWLTHLDRILAALDAPALDNAGGVSHQQAKLLAGNEYEKFKVLTKDEQTKIERAYVASLRHAQQTIEGGSQ